MKRIVMTAAAVLLFSGCEKPREQPVGPASDASQAPQLKASMPPAPPASSPTREVLAKPLHDALEIGIVSFAHSVGASSGRQNVSGPKVNAAFLEKFRLFLEKYPDGQTGHTVKNVESTLDGSENIVREGGNITLVFERGLNKTFVIEAGSVGVKDKSVFVAQGTKVRVDGARYVFTGDVWLKEQQ